MLLVFYYKMRQLIQNAMVLLQNATVNTKCIGKSLCHTRIEEKYILQIILIHDVLNGFYLFF